MNLPSLLKNSRWCDLRMLIWPVALGLIWFLQRDWMPASVLWEAWQTAPVSFVVAHTTDALVIPGILTATALIGAALARTGRSALNGAYAAFCLLLALVAGYVTWSRASFRLYANDTTAQVRTHGLYFRTFTREEAARLDAREVRSARGIIRHYPIVECADGRKIHVDDWEFAHRLAQAWELPRTAAAEKIIRQYPKRHHPL